MVWNRDVPLARSGDASKRLRLRADTRRVRQRSVLRVSAVHSQRRNAGNERVAIKHAATQTERATIRSTADQSGATKTISSALKGWIRAASFTLQGYTCQCFLRAARAMQPNEVVSLPIRDGARG